MKNRIYLVLIFICANTFAQTPHYTELNLDTIFQEHPATFVLYDLQKDSFEVYNSSRASQKFPVHSTSKIFWSIIGLEEELVTSASDIVQWDSIKYPPKPWWPDGFKQDQTIITALNYSVNWYYFELLKLMSPEMIEKYANNLNYQQGYEVDSIHYFGLTFSIKKNTFEQVEFLKQIYLNEFNLSDNTVDILRKGMRFKQTLSFAIYARTGTGPVPDDNAIGWLIGWIEKGTNTYFFALNIEDEDEVKAGRLRNKYGKKVLKALGLFE